jgi:hypothetical protein
MSFQGDKTFEYSIKTPSIQGNIVQHILVFEVNKSDFLDSTTTN